MVKWLTHYFQNQMVLLFPFWILYSKKKNKENKGQIHDKKTPLQEEGMVVLMISLVTGQTCELRRQWQKTWLSETVIKKQNPDHFWNPQQTHALVVAARRQTDADKRSTGTCSVSFRASAGANLTRTNCSSLRDKLPPDVEVDECALTGAAGLQRDVHKGPLRAWHFIFRRVQFNTIVLTTVKHTCMLLQVSRRSVRCEK